MIKQTITYTNYNDEEVTEDFYFNLDEDELIELELVAGGKGFGETLMEIVEAKDGERLMATFKKVLRMAVGRKSEDGRKFKKNDEIISDFVDTRAYSMLFVKLATDLEFAAEFVNGLLPSGIQKASADQKAPSNPELPAGEEPAEGSKEWYDKKLEDPVWEPNKDDLMKLTPEQLRTAFARKAGSAQP